MTLFNLSFLDHFSGSFRHGFDRLVSCTKNWLVLALFVILYLHLHLISSVPTCSSVQLLPVGVWSGFAPFSPSSSPQPRAPSFFSCGRATAPPIIRSPVHLPRHLRPALHLLSASRKAFPDRDWSRRLSSLAICRQQGVSGPRLVQAFIFTRYPPPPARRIRTATGAGVYLHSLSATRRAYLDPEWSRRSSSLAIRLQEGVSGHRVVQAFIFTRYPPPGRRIGTPSGPAVHFHSLSPARKAYPDPWWSSRSSSLTVCHREGVSRPRLVLPFIFTRYPPPGRRRTPSGPGVHPHSLSASRKAYRDPEWSSRSSSLAVRCHEGVSGPWMVQSFIFTRCPLPRRRIRTLDGPALIFTRCPPPGRRIRTLDGPAVDLHSLSASRKAYPDPEWSSRSSSLAIRCQEGVSGPRLVLPFIFTRYPPPGRRTQTPSGPAVHLHSLSAARRAYPDRDWSRWLSSLAIRRQEGGSGPRLVQAFIFARLSASRRAYPDRDWSRWLSSLAIRYQEGVSGPTAVHPFIFSRYPPPGRRFRTATGPGVHLRSSIRLQEGVYGPEGPTVLLNSPIRRSEDACGSRMVQSFLSARLSATR